MPLPECPVLLIPGFIAGDLSLATLSAWLRRNGYHLIPRNPTPALDAAKTRSLDAEAVQTVPRAERIS